uniref:Lon protease homolog, mitochondrial n=1 Tax=Brassica oleracea var. oleracea TaxID=109376 RepID=A0A0D3AFF5_BRAOL
MLKLLSSTTHTIHHANPSRVGSNPIKTPLFKALSHLTGWNHELGRRRAFCSNKSDAAADPKSDASNPEASDTKSSSSVVVSTTTTSLDDYQTVIALPLPKKPLFPGFYMPIYVKDRKLIEALQESMRRQTPYAGAFLLKDDEASADSSSSSTTCETENVLDKFKGKELLNRMHEVGTLAQISSIQGEQVILIGRRRLRITEMVSEDPLSVKVEHIKNKAYDKDDDVIKATYFEVMSTLRDVLKTTSLWRDQHIGDFNYQHLADFGAGISGANKHENQGVLEELDVHKRLELTLDLLKKEVEVNKIQASIAKTVEEKFSGERRQIVLKEQLKAIKKELGVETDSKFAFSEKFKGRIEVIKDKIPKHVLKVIEEHLTKLQLLEPTSSEFDVTLNYLDWLTVLPWGNLSDENFDVLRAERILDEDHYGLSDVKERILEFIAVGSLRGTSQGKIICLSGPPGVGKTSIGRSIARALDRKFFRFSVGGLSDVAEINGHRRTYIGAMPGKLVQCLKTVGTENPIILIDEIDKLGKGHSGDPASALLEVMDPEQNANFRDHYLDVTIDLSKVLFVCTANVIDTIPKPLLDRMEVISLAGYITDEKLHIARDFLVKNTCRDCGIKPEQVDMSDAALLSLIENYCREAGVRNLHKHIEKIYRKIALKLVRQRASTVVPAVSVDVTDTEDTKPLAKTSAEGSTVLTDESATKTEQSEVVAEKVMIEESNLADYLGKPVFHSDKIYEKTPVGVVMGLAWTSMGGSTLYIETTFVEEVERKGRLRITGQLGSVMKESAQIAHTVARRIMLEKEPDNLFLANSKLHLHVPEGATPKDGPSAGCTMITSLLSLAMKKPVRKDLAMTGEVTLTGRILPIGGVKEKTIAARRSQVKMIIFPEANRKDFDELPENVKEGLDVHFVDEYEQIFELAFGLQFLITAEGARTVEHVSSPLMAEALAMREAMQEASALIDQELARAINSKTYPMEFSGVLMDIELLSSSFVFYYVSFIGRELNGVADALAKSALDS